MVNIALQLGNITRQAIGPIKETYTDDYGDGQIRDIGSESL